MTSLQCQPGVVFLVVGKTQDSNLPRVALRIRKLGASRGVQSRGVPANGTLLFDFEPSGQLSAQRVTASYSELLRQPSTERWDNHPIRRFVGVFLARVNVGPKPWENSHVRGSSLASWKPCKQRRCESGERESRIVGWQNDGQFTQDTS